jgi:hypothetical protein
MMTFAYIPGHQAERLFYVAQRALGADAGGITAHLALGKVDKLIRFQAEKRTLDKWRKVKAQAEAEDPKGELSQVSNYIVRVFEAALVETL